MLKRNDVGTDFAALAVAFYGNGIQCDIGIIFCRMGKTCRQGKREQAEAEKRGVHLFVLLSV
ncbi:hypothetical protein NM82_2233 [Neisseria meningitidis NM82]|nr:hypothetical protein NM82_2233 [Neisseria meningitidis NM82]